MAGATKRRSPAVDQPVGAVALDRGDAATLVDRHAGRLAAAAKRAQGAVRIGRAVPPRHQRADTMRAQRRNEPAQLRTIDDLFMRVAELPHLRRALVQLRQMLFGLRNPDLAVRVKAATVADDRLDAMPHVHRFERDRHLGEIAAKRADAGGGRARRVAADPRALENDDTLAGTREVKRRGQAVQAAADHDDVGMIARHGSASYSSAASSPSVIGFSGGRTR